MMSKGLMYVSQVHHFYLLQKARDFWTNDQVSFKNCLESCFEKFSIYNSKQ